jgi:hypothetical protein
MERILTIATQQQIVACRVFDCDRGVVGRDDR